MKKIELADATAPLADYARGVAKEPVLITDNGEPVAVLVLPSDVDLESLTLATDPWFLDIIERSRESYRRHGGIPADAVWRELGLEQAPQAPKAAPAKVGSPPKARRRNS
jgi:prevent-host-death family protein